jgi:hypothetical protein
MQFEARGRGTATMVGHYNAINISFSMPMENKTARLTVLVDPAKKQAFEKVCHAQDMTPSQVLRRLIREFMDTHAPASSPPRNQPARKRSR